MATRGRIPLSRVLEELDASAGPVADGSDDDLGMDSDYYNSSGEGIFLIIIILSQIFIHIISSEKISKFLCRIR